MHAIALSMFQYLSLHPVFIGTSPVTWSYILDRRDMRDTRYAIKLASEHYKFALHKQLQLKSVLDSLT